MATGKPAFTGATTGIIQEAILGPGPSASTANPKIPCELDGIISKALEKDRDLRYQHAADMRADLKRLKRDPESGRSAALAPQPASRPRLIGSLAAVAALAALGWFFLNPHPKPSEELAQKPSVEFSQKQLTFNPSEDPVTSVAISRAPCGFHWGNARPCVRCSPATAVRFSMRQDPVQADLVKTISDNSWRLRRLGRNPNARILQPSPRH